jgi:hypothetical protein
MPEVFLRFISGKSTSFLSRSIRAGILIVAAAVVLTFPVTLLFGPVQQFYILGFIGGLLSTLAIIFLALCSVRDFRKTAGKILVYCSYALAVDVIIQSLIITMTIFGLKGVIVGILFFGVGVYFMSLIALLSWQFFLPFVVYLVVGVLITAFYSVGDHFSKMG